MNGKRSFYRLARHADTDLAKARARCREARVLIDEGIDPRFAEAQQRETARLARLESQHRGSVEQLFGVYVTHCVLAGSEAPKRLLPFTAAM
jgi:hypothetical protein